MEHTYNGVLFSLKKERFLTTCDNVERPEDIMPYEISQPSKDKYVISYLRRAFKILKHIKRWLPKVRGKGDMEYLVNGYKVAYTQDE